MSVRAGLAITLALATGLASGCGNRQADEEQALKDATDALFDTDKAATEALRKQLATRFGTGADTEAIEKALAGEGYDCQPDPGAPAERACLREVPRGDCTEMTIARIKPWRPEGAQVIVVCEKG
ncbi:MAG: hypothetical protein MUF14_03070 [Hyphomonadaceae bacterium]|jgi:hypothetical protein|nr:hypothetical protein [Hyphomonadaceae bacterium]